MYSEGKVKVYSGNAFVNDAAKLTRDVGVAIASREHARDALDCTAATGIRGMRYVLEAGVPDCTFLEINRKAYLTLKRNLARNSVSAEALNTSVQEFANSPRGRFGLIDLDPFGGISPYTYDLMKLARDNTLFFATATDTGVLCGAHHKACLRLYGAVPMHNEVCKEAGMRILVGHIARTAAQFNFGIEPLLSMTYRHYVRAHVRLGHGSEKAMASIRSLGFMHFCDRCGARGVQKGLVPRSLQCECGNRLQLSGPLWIGSLHDGTTASAIADAVPENGSDASFLERLAREVDAPAVYSIPRITRKLGIGSVSPSSVVDLLSANGKRVSLAHYDTSYVRTDAGIGEVTEAVRAAAKAKRTIPKIPRLAQKDV